MARPPAYLFTGPEELLLHRAAQDLLEELRAEGPVEVADLRAGDIAERSLPDLRTGSLFSDRRVVLVREAETLPSEVSSGLVAQLEGAPPDALVVLLASGTGRIVKLASRIAELGGRVDVAPPREWEARRWAALVSAEFARHDRRATAEAVEEILDHAGFDVAAIAEKVAQVASTAPEGQVDIEAVAAVVTGHGNQGAFAVADAMCARDPAQALTLLRGVLEAGDDPIMVVGALAYRLRTVFAVAAGIEGADIGLRISPGQVGHLRRARQGFGPGELTRAFRTLADADRDLKGGELPAALVIERAVADIATPAPATTVG